MKKISYRFKLALIGLAVCSFYFSFSSEISAQAVVVRPVFGEFAPVKGGGSSGAGPLGNAGRILQIPGITNARRVS